MWRKRDIQKRVTEMAKNTVFVSPISVPGTRRALLTMAPEKFSGAGMQALPHMSFAVLKAERFTTVTFPPLKTLLRDTSSA